MPRLGHFWGEDGRVWGLRGALHIANGHNGDRRVCQEVQESSHRGKVLHQPQKPPSAGSRSLAQPSGRESAGGRKTEEQRTVLCQDSFLPCMGPRLVAMISDPRTVRSWLASAGHKLSGTELRCARPSPEAELHHVNRYEWKRNPIEIGAHSPQCSEHSRPRAKLALRENEHWCLSPALRTHRKCCSVALPAKERPRLSGEPTRGRMGRDGHRLPLEV